MFQLQDIVDDSFAFYVSLIAVVTVSLLIYWKYFFKIKKFKKNKTDIHNNSLDDHINELDFDDGHLTKSICIKKIREEVKKSLSKDQLEEEKKIERAQLATIYKYLKKQSEELNTEELDEEQIMEQLNLYR